MFILVYSGPTLEVCLYSVTVWSIIVPITVCVTVVSMLLVSGWSIPLTAALKRLSSCHGNQRNSLSLERRDNTTKNQSAPCVQTEENGTHCRSEEAMELPLYSLTCLVLIILLGILLFVVVVLSGDLYSNTAQILRSQMAITLTSTFQMVILYSGKDSCKVPAVSAGDRI